MSMRQEVAEYVHAVCDKLGMTHRINAYGNGDFLHALVTARFGKWVGHGGTLSEHDAVERNKGFHDATWTYRTPGGYYFRMHSMSQEQIVREFHRIAGILGDELLEGASSLPPLPRKVIKFGVPTEAKRRELQDIIDEKLYSRFPHVELKAVVKEM